MQNMTTAGAILAGGRARRFGGQDKSRLVFGGRSIIVRQVDLLQRVATEVFVVASDRDRFSDLGIPVHPDILPGRGALGGLYTALETATSDLVLVIACDLPFLVEGLLRALRDRAGAGDGAWVRTSRGVEPLIACYRRTARDAVRAAIDAGDLRAADLAARLDMSEVDEATVAAFGPPDRILANINTREESIIWNLESGIG